MSVYDSIWIKVGSGCLCLKRRISISINYLSEEMTKIINAQGKGESSLISDDKDGNDTKYT